MLRFIYILQHLFFFFTFLIIFLLLLLLQGLFVSLFEHTLSSLRQKQAAGKHIRQHVTLERREVRHGHTAEGGVA